MDDMVKTVPQHSAGPSAKRHTLRTPSDLIDAGLATEADRATLEAVGERFTMAIPPVFRDLITHPDDPIARQVIPDARELVT
ncbi:MAG: lysine 2,3-aminomutase, partial [Gluconobacter oxydans]